MLSSGLRDLVDNFKQAGHGEVADSWVGRGPNKQIAPSQVAESPANFALKKEKTLANNMRGHSDWRK
jgi:uncharacterized protein YidB (DUF937 family)